MKTIKHKIGKYSEYDKTLYEDFVYFATDAKKIILNGIEYGFDLESEDNYIIEDISIDEDFVMKLKYTNHKEAELKLKRPNKYWEELEVEEEEDYSEFINGGFILETYPTKGIIFGGRSGAYGRYLTDEGEEGKYFPFLDENYPNIKRPTDINFNEHREHKIKLYNEFPTYLTEKAWDLDNAFPIKKIICIPGQYDYETGGISFIYDNILGEIDDEVIEKMPMDYEILEGTKLLFGGAFFSNKFIREIKLPSTIEVVGSFAFYQCINVKGDLILPEGLKEIKKSAFNSCINLDGNLVVPSTLKEIGEDAFRHCENLKGHNIIFNEGLEFVYGGAFNKCEGLSGYMVLPKGVKAVGEGAFKDLGLDVVYVHRDTYIAPYNFYVTTYDDGETPWLD